MPNLFRPEAIEGQRQVWLGSIQIVRPMSLSVLTGVVVGVLLLVVTFLALGEYTRKARVSGVLMPDRGVIRLLPPQPSSVLERHAREGQAVRQGDVLFVLSLDSDTATGETQALVQRSLSERERSLQGSVKQQTVLLDTQRDALQRRLADMRLEGVQMAAEAELHRQRLALGQQALTRLESLRSEQFISSAQVQAKNEEVLGLQAQQQALERQRLAHAREMATVEGQLRELPLLTQTRKSEIERELADVTRMAAEAEARRRLVVRAPQDGVVTAVLADVGQVVLPAVPLASLMPAEARLEAHLFAPSSAVGFVRANQAVLLRYQAFPYQKFGHQAGRVLQVSRAPLQGAELAGLGETSGEPMYRITVALDRQAVPAYGVEQPLVAGMQLDADVQLDRRRLIEWIFEPILSVAGRV